MSCWPVCDRRESVTQKVAASGQDRAPQRERDGLGSLSKQGLTRLKQKSHERLETNASTCHINDSRFGYCERVYGFPSNGLWLALFHLSRHPDRAGVLKGRPWRVARRPADAQTESYFHCPPFMASASTKRLHVQSQNKTTLPLLRSNNKRSPSSCRAAT